MAIRAPGAGRRHSARGPIPAGGKLPGATGCSQPVLPKARPFGPRCCGETDCRQSVPRAGRRSQLPGRGGQCRPEATTVQLNETISCTTPRNAYKESTYPFCGPSRIVQFRTVLGRIGQDWAGLGSIGHDWAGLGRIGQGWAVRCSLVWSCGVRSCLVPAGLVSLGIAPGHRPPRPEGWQSRPAGDTLAFLPGRPAVGRKEAPRPKGASECPRSPAARSSGGTRPTRC